MKKNIYNIKDKKIMIIKQNIDKIERVNKKNLMIGENRKTNKLKNNS